MEKLTINHKNKKKKNYVKKKKGKKELPLLPFFICIKVAFLI
jgi:hypothetical protein